MDLSVQCAPTRPELGRSTGCRQAPEHRTAEACPARPLGRRLAPDISKVRPPGDVDVLLTHALASQAWSCCAATVQGADEIATLRLSHPRGLVALLPTKQTRPGEEPQKAPECGEALSPQRRPGSSSLTERSGGPAPSFLLSPLRQAAATKAPH